MPDPRSAFHSAKAATHNSNVHLTSHLLLHYLVFFYSNITACLHTAAKLILLIQADCTPQTVNPKPLDMKKMKSSFYKVYNIKFTAVWYSSV